MSDRYSNTFVPAPVGLGQPNPKHPERPVVMKATHELFRYRRRDENDEVRDLGITRKQYRKLQKRNRKLDNLK